MIEGDIVLQPPDENGVLSDQDSEDESSEPTDLNHLGRGILNAEAEFHPIGLMAEEENGSKDFPGRNEGKTFFIHALQKFEQNLILNII